MSTKPKRPVLPATEVGESMVYPFSEMYRRGIAALKNNKAAGIDVLIEQLNNICPKTHKWRLAMINNYFTKNKFQQYGRNQRSSPY